MVDLPAEQAEIDLLLRGIYDRYGYDFRNYSQLSLRRRIQMSMTQVGVNRLTELLDHLFHDQEKFSHFIKYMSVPVTDFFRDPDFYKSLRDKVIPILQTYTFIKVWHAGCSTGEEAYSMAVLLHEAGLIDRSRLYATDFDQHSLNTAQNGVYQTEKMMTWIKNYRASGGVSDLMDFCSCAYDFIKIRRVLSERITFSYHNLVSDGVFGEMNIIFCRNVLIYFDRELQDRVLRLLSDSLRHGGFLCLGSRETLRFSSVRSHFEPVDEGQKIYKKIGYGEVGS